MKGLYGSVLLLLLIGFVAASWETVRGAVAETDLCWMIPAVLQGAERGSFLDGVRFLFSSGPPKVADFFIKVYLVSGLSWFGVHVRGLILFAMGMHGVTAGLVYLLGRALGLGRRIGALSAAVYLCLFTHFHAVLWPPAVAFHLFSGFFILLVFLLYLKTERRVSEGSPYRGLLWLTVGVGLAASLNRSAILIPLVLLSHLLLEKDPHRRLSAYRRWTPLLAVSLLQPVYWVVVIRQWATSSLLRRVVEGLAAIPFPVPVKLIGVWVLGIGSILAFGGLLRWLTLGRGRRIGLKGFFLAVAVGGAALLAAYDRRQILLPYNALVPFAVTLSAFLQPIRAALSLDSTYPFYLFRASLDGSDLLLAAAVIGLFVAVYVRRQRQLAALLGWYGATLLHFLFQFSNQPVTAPSRHFLYVSPIFSLLFCSTFSFVGTILMPGERRAKAREVLLLGLVALLCAENLVAIRLAEWRGKLVNHYYTYEDIRTARLIQEDFQGRGTPAPHGEALAVTGVVAMPFGYGTWYFMEINPDDHRLFRFVLEEVFQDRSMRRSRVNSPQAGDGQGVGVPYRVYGVRVTDPEGRSLDPFDRTFEEASLRMSQGDDESAWNLFRRAAGWRPFLLRFVLPEGGRPEDVQWLTQGLGLRRWLGRIRDTWGKPGTTIPKNRSTAQVLEKELTSYEACLLALAYLGQRHGREGREGRRHWLSQLYHLEPDPAALAARLSRNPLVQSNPQLSQFLGTLREGGAFMNPARWQKDDYGFGRFLARLLIRWDIASGWDKGGVIGEKGS